MCNLKKIFVFGTLLIGSLCVNGQGLARTFNVKGVSFNMMVVDGGSFNMGATSEQVDPFDDEKPVHKVTLSSYYIGETEVTQALWEAVMGEVPSFNKGSNKPVDCINRDDCLMFIKRLNQITGANFRLPTEAEWEYAARGGNKSKGYVYSGSNSLNDVAWNITNSGSSTHDVKTKMPNELGIYDMSGNVWEWCSDYKGNYTSAAQVNPAGANSGFFVVYRGGSAFIDSRRCRVSARYADAPEFKGNCHGMRLALDGDNTPAVPNVSNDKVKTDFSSAPVVNPVYESPAVNTASDVNSSVYRSSKSRQCFANGVVFNMVYVEGGEFMMGATPEHTEYDDDQTPVHKVKISKGYYIGETEVTQELWMAVMGSNPSIYNGLQRPVENVSWKDCQVFISRLNALTGMTFRLPTEAEWEYAARGANQTEVNQYSGSYELDEVAWYSENSTGFTQPVKTKAPNELGIYDMSGNVWEWCNDWFRFYAKDDVVDPTGPETGYYRVYRGGSWAFASKYCTVSFRCSDNDTSKNVNIGLRLAM